MTRTVRSITLAFAVLALCSSASHARPSASRLAPEGLLTAVWERVVNWFAPEVLNAPREKAGSQMDPNGVTLSTTAPESLETDAGSSMDPNGHR